MSGCKRHSSGGDPIVDEKILNEHYVADINYAIQYTRWLLKFIGIWPNVVSNSTKIEKFVSKIVMILYSVIMMTLPIFNVSHVTVRQVDRLEFLVHLGPIGFFSTNVLIYFALFVRTDTVKLCVRHMEQDWRNIEIPLEREIMKKNLRVGHGLTKICMFCMYSCCLFYHVIMPLWTGSVINNDNETVRPLAYPGTDIFVDSQARITYEIVFGGIFISAFLHFTVITSIFNLAAVLVTHACGQIQIVMTRLSGLVDLVENESNVGTVWHRIAIIVQRHVRVLRFSARIDQVLREICLIEVVASTVIICLLEYYCLAEWNNGNGVAMITYTLLLFSLGFNMFIYCLIGELLKEQCSRVGTAAYMIDWYKLPGKTGLALVMVMTMANYPRKLTAGRMVELSINTFGSIIRTSLGYLNILRAVAE